jgi:hypothetical protein
MCLKRGEGSLDLIPSNLNAKEPGGLFLAPIPIPLLLSSFKVKIIENEEFHRLAPFTTNNSVMTTGLESL